MTPQLKAKIEEMANEEYPFKPLFNGPVDENFGKRFAYEAGATAMYQLMQEREKVMSDHFGFLLNAAENLYRPDKPLGKGLCPTFYHTLNYEGDLELINKTIAARQALTKLGILGE